MSDEKMKVSDLPEQEQKELIAEAYSLGATGVFTGWKVSTLKNKIEELKAQKNGEGTKNEEAKDEGANDEQNAPKDEQDASNDEQNGADDEQNASKDEGANETGETIVAGDGGTFDENGEENKPEAEKEGEGEEEKAEAKKEEPKKQTKEKKEPRYDGICHICRSKVLDGVCTGCGFTK